MKRVWFALVCLVLLPVHPARSDGAADNLPDNVRRIPPPGVPIPDDARQELTTAAARLKENIDGSAAAWEHFPMRLKLLPDVQVFWKAVDWALRYDEFYDLKQIEWARRQLKEGAARLEALEQDQVPWLAQTGLVVRGYRSRIDGSVQPFGLVVPPSFNPNYPHRWRLDCWFHGRGEKLTELDFIHGRQTSPGEFTPQDTIVLHPYGRYCNGQRFAGETDFFEALDAVKRDYRIDEDRIVVRGFSLGGAACWHLAAHHAWQWCAAAPGAGFSETEEFLNFFQREKLQPAPWERKLWNLYDATAVAANFFNLPTVAYSGELDKQKQAAEAVARVIGADDTGKMLKHLVGPKTGHKYEMGAKLELNRIIDSTAERGRDPLPRAVKFATPSLRYDRMEWLRVVALKAHWVSIARIQGSWNRMGFNIETTGVGAFEIAFPAGGLPVDVTRFGVTVDDQPMIEGELSTPSDRSLEMLFAREGNRWRWIRDARFLPTALRKKHGLQGPIDDAFMDSFIFVRPTGTAANEKLDAWAKAELARAIVHWRRHFRGDARVKDDFEVTDHDLSTSNIVVWGDPSSNKLLAKFADKLPISWTPGEIKAGDRSFAAASHALIAIYPNPLNPGKYVVLNTSFTFREYDYLNNARQTPKLPDWAVIDLETPPHSRGPGKVVAADFFGEKWELKPSNP